MGEEEEPQFSSLKERIAALKLQQDAPPIAPGLKPKPAPPIKPKPAVAPKPTPATSSQPTPAVRATPSKRWPPVGQQPPASPEPADEPEEPVTSSPPFSPPVQAPPASTLKPSKRWPPVGSKPPAFTEPEAEAEEKESTEPSAPSLPARPPLPQRRTSAGTGAPSLPPRKDAPPLPNRRDPPPMPTRHSNHSGSSTKSPPTADRRLPPPAPSPSASPAPSTSSSTATKKPPPLPSAPRPPIPTAPRPAVSKKAEPNDEEEREEKPKARFMVPLPPGGLEKPPPLPRSNGAPPIPGADKPSGSGPPPIPVSSRPPPVPTSSRPKTSTYGPKSNGYAYSPANPYVAPGEPDCLICRDYSGPDSVAAQYPTSSVPGPHRIPYLADVLCSPFPSLTDKARAVFTWLHHNIRYDVDNFFAGTVPRGLTAEDTIERGLAVCEGFADVFGSICAAAGLEVRHVSGYGKGFGFSTEDASASADSNHAWNAVRIESGWKLVDSCWGAGHISDQRQWVVQFNPSMFTMSNEQFGRRHYPSRWEDWFGPAKDWNTFLHDGEGGPQRYNTADDVGLGMDAFPYSKTVPRGEAVTIQTSYKCPHWTRRSSHASKLIFVYTNGEIVRVNDNGEQIWADLRADQVQSGQITLSVMDKVNGRSPDGMTWQEFDSMRSKSYGMQHLFSWDIV